MSEELFAPACSITTTKRRRFFWAAWWTAPPVQVPFRRPDASDGGEATWDEAIAAASKRAGMSLSAIDPLWARAWMRILRGEEPWPSRASRSPRAPSIAGPRSESIWDLLGVGAKATAAELKAAYRQRALETHPDHGGDDAAFRRVVHAYEEAQRRIARPKGK